jgi:DNA-binding transcriptional MerR regulator
VKLTIEQLSKLTKLSIPTLRVYVSRQKLGTKVGNRRVFSQLDVQKLVKASKKPRAERKSKAPARRIVARKKPAKPETAGTSAGKSKANSSKPGSQIVKSSPRSFWSRLFGGKKQAQKQKISLLDAKTSK